MTRQKVNGNGIRAAGNPDEEPVLSNFPNCPPTLPSNSCNSSLSHNDSEGQDNDQAGERPYSRLVGGPPSHAKGEKEITINTDETSSTCSTGGEPMSRVLRRFSRSEPLPTQATFPLKLQRILDKIDADGSPNPPISWLPHGR